MQVLIGLFQKIAGTNYTCDQLIALAQQYSCVPRPLQILVLIALAQQIVNNGGGGENVPSGAGYVFAGNYGGFAPPFSPSSAAAIATDTSTSQQWNWYNGQWQ